LVCKRRSMNLNLHFDWTVLDSYDGTLCNSLTRASHFCKNHQGTLRNISDFGSNPHVEIVRPWNSVHYISINTFSLFIAEHHGTYLTISLKIYLRIDDLKIISLSDHCTVIIEHDGREYSKPGCKPSKPIKSAHQPCNLWRPGEDQMDPSIFVVEAALWGARCHVCSFVPFSCQLSASHNYTE